MFENIVEAGKQQSEASYSVRCQFLEIYGEEIRDLLDPIAGSVTIREGQNGDVVVHGAREDPVEDAEVSLASIPLTESQLRSPLTCAVAPNCNFRPCLCFSRGVPCVAQLAQLL
jgi:hypothetical protein